MKKGYFGNYGGMFIPETLYPCLKELEKNFKKHYGTKQFKREFNYYLSDYVGRPSPLYCAERLSSFIGAKIYLKREDLNHTGAHKINNTLGQIILARLMNKKRIIAETGAGQHGLATATVCALFNLKCVIYMGSVDIVRQKLNVIKMRMLGAEVREVKDGTATLKDATSAAIKDWVENVRNTHYIIGSVVGPHPYPLIVREFQRIIGKETKKQIMKKEKRQPDYVVACVGGGSNAMGIFYDFLNTKTRLIGVEAGGLGIKSGKHGVSLSFGKPGVLHGSFSYVLQNKGGQVMEAHSVSAGLDYPGVGPEHSYLKDIKKVKYGYVSDNEAVRAFYKLTRLEGIIPALESSHAIAYLIKHKNKFKKNDIIVVNLSGRGDKDVESVLDFKK